MSNNKDFTDRFSEWLYAVYDYARFKKLPEMRYEDILDDKPEKKHFWNRKPKEKKPLDVFISRLNEFTNDIDKKVPTFEDMWDFCEFIRIAEKIFFYENTPESSKIYSECTIGDQSSTRKFVLKYDKYDILFTLEKAKILDRSLLKDQVIKIHVRRLYGLQMENKYTIINSNMDFLSDSDLYLINEINRLLQENMKSIFVNIIEKAFLDKYVYYYSFISKIEYDAQRAKLHMYY